MRVRPREAAGEGASHVETEPAVGINRLGQQRPGRQRGSKGPGANGVASDPVSPTCSCPASAGRATGQRVAALAKMLVYQSERPRSTQIDLAPRPRREYATPPKS
jgi:hypothetical protein